MNRIGSLSPLASALDLIYPPSCATCAQRLHPFEQVLCDPCRREMLTEYAWRCPQCGGTGEGQRPGRDEPCDLCPPPGAEYRGVLSAVQYRGPAPRCVALFKYNRRMEIGRLMADVMVARLLEPLRALDERVKWIVPVPLHWGRRMGRGFNQSLLLARRLGEALELPVRPDALKRVKYTRRQTRLPRHRREENVRGAFRAPARFAGGVPGVLLVDDVVTGGFTAAECARMLTGAGAPQVWVASFARA